MTSTHHHHSNTHKEARINPENIFLPMECKIVRAHQATPAEKHFTLKMADGAILKFEPGQILEVSLFGYGEIPIGIASSPTREHTFDIVVRTVGRVSTAINRLTEGDSLYIRGPLGRGFPLEKLRGHNILVVAGGIGLCPTRSLIQYILDRRKEFKKFTLFYGTRSPDQQLFLDDLRVFRNSPDVHYFETVDQSSPGWNGHVGLITTLFNKVKIESDTRVVICGPPVVFKFVVAELDKLGVNRENIYVDLERRMKCGVGKCGHCQINDKYCCLDGPVFSIKETSLLEEAF